MARYIKATDATEVLSEKYGIPYAELVDDFANIPTADVQEVKWISVEDRLPDKDGFYNVVMDGDIWGEPGVKAATSCGFYDGKWDEDGATIYYWMPLPKPPKMDGGAE